MLWLVEGVVLVEIFLWAFQMQVRMVCRVGMLAGLSPTTSGAITDPIMPPTAPEPAIAAVDQMRSASPNQV